ncbi:hypothetical protein Bp8pS_158 [Bacillus phage vB_BpuM-BpSp]|nr:hypothetical protein Bp8pS_158 [Bacillus phage vB_BpuM-BpSp]
MVFNRLNPSQLIEQELNWISKHIRKYIEEEQDLSKKEEILLDYLQVVNKEETEIMKEYISHLDNNQKEEFFNELVEKGIPICQKPFFDNVGLDELFALYEKYDDIDYFNCEGITTPLIIGELYFLRLKHEPQSKFSARSTSFMNLRNLPAKSKSYKENKELHSKTPVRLGNMEISNLSLVNDMEPIMNMLNSYSNNKTNRRELITQLLTGNPFDPEIEYTDMESNTSKILKALMTGLGLKIEDTNSDEEE